MSKNELVYECRSCAKQTPFEECVSITWHDIGERHILCAKCVAVLLEASWVTLNAYRVDELESPFSS